MVTGLGSESIFSGESGLSIGAYWELRSIRKMSMERWLSHCISMVSLPGHKSEINFLHLTGSTGRGGAGGFFTGGRAGGARCEEKKHQNNKKVRKQPGMSCVRINC